MLSKATLFVIVLAAFEAAGTPTGAPPSACQDMNPGHDVDAQPDPAPYHLMVSTIEQGRRYEFAIMANSSASLFQGFMIQAKDPSIEEAVGSFEVGADAQTIDCFGRPASSATHVDSTDKFVVYVTWNAPVDPLPEVHVVYTVAQEMDVFWVHQHHVLIL